VIFSDIHSEVDNTGLANNLTFPTECDVANAGMSAQEHPMEFQLFDLANCVTPDQ
jgi:hypothetical protein